MIGWIFALVVILILVFYIRRFGRVVVRRIGLVRNIKRICAERGYRFRRVRNPVASFFSVGALPDFTVSAEKEYCIRLITTAKSKRVYHFLDERYAASCTKGAVPLIGAVGPVRAETLSRWEKFHLFPEFRLPKDMERMSDAVPILLFNPVPAKIVALDDEERKCNEINAGGRIGRFTAFGGSAFCDLLEGRPPVEHKKSRWGE